MQLGFFEIEVIYMLKVFKVKNFMSFKDETILDLRTSKTESMDKDLELFKSLAITGTNASGKSNMVLAVAFFRRFILSLFYNKRLDDVSNVDFDVRLEPFRFSSPLNPISEFEMVFTRNANQFRYGFKITSKDVLNEWYYINNRKVFDRSDSNVTYGHEFEAILKPYAKIAKQRLYIAILEFFLTERSELFLCDFMCFFSRDLFISMDCQYVFPRNVNDERRLISSDILNDKPFMKIIEDLLVLSNLGIKRIEIQEDVLHSKFSNTKVEKIMKCAHYVYDDSENAVGEAFLHLRNESIGIQRFLSYMQLLVQHINTGAVYIMDELFVHMHPILEKFVLNIFSNANNLTSQLIFTTLKTDIQDLYGICYIEKNYRGESRVFTRSMAKEDAKDHDFELSADRFYACITHLNS
jgi:AAA15 family ATPase/GTPase